VVKPQYTDETVDLADRPEANRPKSTAYKELTPASCALKVSLQRID
jgi:hypothetical protein